MHEPKRIWDRWNCASGPSVRVRKTVAVLGAGLFALLLLGTGMALMNLAGAHGTTGGSNPRAFFDPT
ncbi:MAG TPA: hypothetical protein P5055_16745, partial [Candidatus Paceibacterota bacterium]|nr:hypothetical protein [Candidatus Paceibacterota bacterium]